MGRRFTDLLEVAQPDTLASIIDRDDPALMAAALSLLKRARRLDRAAETRPRRLLRGARNRQGQPCQRWACKGRARCRLHGGASMEPSALVLRV